MIVRGTTCARALFAVVFGLGALSACGSTDAELGADAGFERDAGASLDADMGADAASELDAGGGADAGTPAPTAADLLRLVSTCQLLQGTTKFATDDGEAPRIDVCTLNGAVWWTADMDVDCDGGRTAICRADPAYMAETSITDSTGQPVDAATVPFVVVPLPSNGFDYAARGIHLGAAVAVLYGGQLQYGVFADEGPEGIIGEASYAMAVLLGVDPDPVTGGADSGATYIVFTGEDAVLARPEDQAEAVRIGEARAAALLRAQ